MERNSAAEAKAREGSRMFERAHRIVNEPDKYPPFIVKKAYRFIESFGQDLLKDLEYGTLDADIADKIFTGLYHYEGYEIIRRDPGESGPLNGVN